MVFSTLLPTLLHLMLTLLSLERIMLLGLNKPFANLIRAGQTRGIEPVVAPLAGGVALALPFLALYGFGSVVWYFGGEGLRLIGQGYMNALLSVAVWIEAI